MPLSELDIDEIHYLMKAIGESKNIGAGQTELIISTILWIFIKLIQDKEGASAKNFRNKYGRTAIVNAMDILMRNLRRKINEEAEAEEKLSLSMSCLFFLMTSSSSPELKKELKEESPNFFKEILMADSYFTFKDHR